MYIIVIVDNFSIEKWKYSAIEELIKLDQVKKIDIFNINSSRRSNGKINYPQSYILRKIEKILFGLEYDSLKKIDISNLKFNIVNSINNTSCDLVVNFSGKNIKCNHFLKAKYGIWRYFFGNNFDSNEGYAGREEYFCKKGYIETGVIAEEWLGKDLLLYDKKSGLDNASMCAGIENLYWGCSLFIPMLIKRLATYGEGEFFTNRKLLSTHINKGYDNKVTNTFYEFYFCIKNYVWQAVVKYVFSCKWIILFSYKEGDRSYQSISEYKRLISPKGKFWADPFVVKENGDYYIFFEELSYKNWKGYISYIQIYPDSSYSEPVKVLENPYHLSYPFIFKYKNEYFMIPETGDNHTIELYKSCNFPNQWEFQKNLMSNIQAYDTTLLEYKGCWWMFTVVQAHEKCMPSEDLYVFYADSPLSNTWQAHKNNPVVSDVTSARPAGKFFIRNNKLYRPSQNCAGIYGKGLNINEVTELSTESYQEKNVFLDTADWSHRITGLHTYNHETDLVVSDALYYQLIE